MALGGEAGPSLLGGWEEFEESLPTCRVNAATWTCNPCTSSVNTATCPTSSALPTNSFALSPANTALLAASSVLRLTSSAFSATSCPYDGTSGSDTPGVDHDHTPNSPTDTPKITGRCDWLPSHRS